MIKLSQKSRRVLRAVYRGVGATAAALTLNACNWSIIVPDRVMYGPGPDGPPYIKEEVYLHGYVKSKKTNERITGISIYIKDITTNYPYLVNEDGRFYLYLPKQDEYTVIFTDIDGDENGRFKQLTLKLTREKLENLEQLIVELEEVDEETDAE